MKRNLIFILSLMFFAIAAHTQTPAGFSYQAVARDASGQILGNQSVSFRVSILQGSASGASVFSETHTANTNAFGLVNLTIGGGQVINGDFSAISWGAGTHFVQIEMDETGGANFQLMGTSQLLSVPYALHAKTAENVPAPLKIGDTYAGGIIFYLAPDGVHGLVAATEDISPVQWGCVGTDLAGVPNVACCSPSGAGADIGWGAVNTKAIVDACNQVTTPASLCDDLVLNGYNDWFLPSAVELNLLYTNLYLMGLGNLNSRNYWSSSEANANFAWYQDFFTGSQTTLLKNNTSNPSLRAVRAF